MTRRNVVRRIACLTGVLSGLLTAPALASPAGGRWSGKLDEYTSKLHFTVQGNRVTKFTVPEAPAYCLTEFSAISVYIPTATIRGANLTGSHKVQYDGETETIKLSGHISGRSAHGSVHMQGPCDGTWTWSAHR
jgi:hypothetical protein